MRVQTKVAAWQQAAHWLDEVFESGDPLPVCASKNTNRDFAAPLRCNFPSPVIAPSIKWKCFSIIKCSSRYRFTEYIFPRSLESMSSNLWCGCLGVLQKEMVSFYKDGRLFYGVDGGPNFTEAFEITSGKETQITTWLSPDFKENMFSRF